jgi:protein-S-isoprenylcysteine O-methyltransferase Ste14
LLKKRRSRVLWGRKIVVKDPVCRMDVDEGQAAASWPVRPCPPSAVRRIHPDHARFLFQWPTLLMLLMFPVLVWMYVRLARREEAEVRPEFGEAYAQYAARTPAFIRRVHRAPVRQRA